MIILPGLSAHGDLPTAADIQTDLFKATHGNEAEAYVQLAISVPEYSGMDPIVFEGRFITPYSRRNGSVSVDSSEVQTLLTELKDIPEKMKPLTIGIKLLNRNVDARWDKKLDGMVLSKINLNVALYKKDKWQINSQTKPALQFALKNIDVSVEEIDIADEKFYGCFLESDHLNPSLTYSRKDAVNRFFQAIENTIPKDYK